MTFACRSAATIVLVVIAAACQSSVSSSTKPSPALGSTLSPTASPSVVRASAPSLSLPGTIAFARGEFPAPENYFTIRPDGSGERDLFSIEGCSCLQLAPNGQTIWAQSETKWGTLAFATMEAGDKDRTVVVPSPKTLSLATGPHASTPDGGLVAFWGWDDTNRKAAGLYLAAPDLGGLRQVIGLPKGSEWITPYGITPDGAKVLFFVERGRVGGVTHTGDLFLVDATGKNLRKLNPDGSVVAEVGGRLASLSPDGRRVAFAAVANTEAMNHGGLFLVAANGGAAEQVAEADIGVFSAIWSPRGERILFGNEVIDTDGSNSRDLSGAGEIGSIIWSPDGTHLVVARGPQGSRDVWIMDLDGNLVSQVTHDPGTYTVWDWR